MEPDREMINFWLDNLKKEIEESKNTIDDEIREIEGTISNERVWLKGSSTELEEELHNHNIITLNAYLEILKEMKR